LKLPHTEDDTTHFDISITCTFETLFKNDDSSIQSKTIMTTYVVPLFNDV